uniref:Leucine-rich repeat-containing N-terminal plant-type domain-containing protein n=1 Tax=Kalanchoe fedtschenkoi TaxID=63787 RepID=A0A7N0U3H2_KALFE
MSRHNMRLRYYCDMCLFTTLLLISVSFSISGEDNSEHGDRTTLLALRDGFTSGGTPPPDGSALSSWNSSFHFCQWQGVTCGKRHKRVTTIRLTEQMLDGVLPPSIGNLTFLRKLDLRNNSLHGQVPEEIGRLRRLRDLYLERNFFGGRIPVELSNCQIFKN